MYGWQVNLGAVVIRCECECQGWICTLTRFANPSYENPKWPNLSTLPTYLTNYLSSNTFSSNHFNRLILHLIKHTFTSQQKWISC